MRRLVFYAPFPRGDIKDSGGGQLTAATSINKILSRRFDVSKINSSRAPLERRYKLAKIPYKLGRVAKCAILRTKEKPEIALFFAGSLASLFEVKLASLFLGKECKKVVFFRNTQLININKGTLYSYILRYLLSDTSKVITQGLNLANHLERLNVTNNSIEVIPNWIWINETSLKKTFSKHSLDIPIVHIVFAGRLDKSKGIREFVDAIVKLSDKYNFKATIVGNGTEFDSVKNEISKNNISEVLVTGWLPREQVLDILSTSHLFVIPTYHPEGLPNSMLEAMYFGNAVIACDIGEISGSVVDRQNGFLIPPKSSEEIYKAIAYYLDDNELLVSHGKEAKKQVDNYNSYKVNTERLCSVIESLEK